MGDGLLLGRGSEMCKRECEKQTVSGDCTGCCFASNIFMRVLCRGLCFI